MEIFCRYIYIFTLILGSCFSNLAEAEESKKLDVGAVLSLSGMASTHGKAIKEGLELAQAELKQQGWEIAIKFEDDQTEPKQTVAAVQRLSLNGIKYFIGPTWGILAEPSRPIIIRNKALSLQPCNSSDFLAGDNSRFFFFFSPPTTALPEIKKFLKEQGSKKVAILNNTSSWGDLWARLFSEAAAETNVLVFSTDMVQFNEGSATYASLLAKYKSAGVDTVLSTTSKETTAELLRKMDELHFEGRLLSPDLIDTIGEKLYGPTSAHMNAYSVHPVTNNEFPIAFEKHFNRKPRKYADSAYDSLMSLVEAVTVAGDNPEEVKNYFEKTIRRSGAAGLITFTSNHDVAGRGYEIVKLVTKKEG